MWLRDRLAERGNPVSLTTLSYWRSGRRRPEGAQSLAALSELEHLLNLQPGDLTARVGPTRRAAPRPSPVTPHEDETLRRAAAECYAALGVSPRHSVHDLTTHLVVDVDADGNQRRRTVRSVLQATAGVISELPFIEETARESPVRPIFSGVAGCRPARHYDHPSRRVFGVLLKLDQPIRAPETALVELQMDLPPDFPAERECSHGVQRRNRDSLVWVRFHPDRLPTWCTQFSVVDGRETERPVELTGTSVHVLQRGFGPGRFGIRWDF